MDQSTARDGSGTGREPAPWQLFALRYANHSGRSEQDNFLGGDLHEQGADLDYFIWLARRGTEIVVIDTGFGKAAALARKRTLLCDPVEALRRMNVSVDAVDQVILTHLHYDHAGSLNAFPSARFHLQVAEAAYATGPCMCDPGFRAPFDVENVVDYIRMLYAGRVIFHQGDVELAPGLWLHPIPGHSAGLQAVRVLTARGWVLLASDATHLYANMARRVPFPVLFDAEQVRRGFDRLAALAPSLDHLVPGHDPAVMRAYPAPSPDLAGLAVRLDVPPSLRWTDLA